jgi:hypothetical protein
MRWREIGHQGVAGRAPDALADPIDEPCGQYHAYGSGQREQRLCHGREPIPEHGQRFATAQVVAERAGEDLGDQRRRLGVMLAPSTETRKTGSRLWTSSDDASINRLTKPSAQTPRGIARRPEQVWPIQKDKSKSDNCRLCPADEAEAVFIEGAVS